MKYVVSFLLFVVAVVGLIVGIVFVRDTFNGAANSTPVHAVDFKKFNKDNTTFRLRIEGPVAAEEKHLEVEIEVSGAGRSAKVLRGYQGTVDKRVEFDNNALAYADFVAAMSKTSLRLEPNTKPADWAGECSTGRRYYIEVIQNGKVIKTDWTSSCASSSRANPALLDYVDIVLLFKAQIPDYSRFAAGSVL